VNRSGVWSCEVRTVSHFSLEKAEALAGDTEEDRCGSEEALGEAKGRQAGPGHEGSCQQAT
jgi:hypothetical protein